MGRYKTYLTILLMFSVYMMPFNSARAANIGGWSIGGGISQGASVLYSGAKDVILNGAKKVATGTALVTPAATDVAKLLGRGVGGVALSVAVEQLLGAVDWVLDPANNQIKYKVNPDGIDPNYVFQSSKTLIIYQKINELCEADYKYYFPDLTLSACRKNPSNPGLVQIIVSYNGSDINNYDVGFVISRTEPLDQEQKTLPLSTVAQQVISNAASGNPAAQQAVKAVADTIVAEAETDATKARPIIQQLEATQSIPTDQTAKGEAVPKEQANTENPASSPTANPKGSDLTLNFPVFCNWAPSVCQAANVVIQKPQEWAQDIKAAYDDAVDYFKKEPDTKDDKLDLDQDTQPEPDSSINFSTSCPAKIPLTFNWNGGTMDFSFDFTMWCEAISTFVYPIVVSLGSLHALYIVAGVRQDG
ncbi:virulence factor TspB C-terminal domain-related protein [Acinetobacter ursingii]|uniref:virulence factor TspB C-terminal domain-related protein n=1 Tax=Acinetobacter ursingii TaxID=108980 RepID=UPI000E6AB7F4|nr:virulence factor TspB C-terminal domain-related protein [Acinetobacter ursingii]